MFFIPIVIALLLPYLVCVFVFLTENYLIISTYQLRAEKYALAELMGLTDGTISDTVEFPSIDNVEDELITNLNIYLDTALQNRPDLKQSREILESTKYYYYSRWGQFFPTISFDMSGGYEWDRNRSIGSKANNPPPFNQTFHVTQEQAFFNYGLNMNWVLFEGGRRIFELRESQAQLAEQEYKLEEQWLKVISEVRQTYDDSKRSAKQLILFEKIQDASTQNRDLVEEEYKAGNTSITRLNQAQRDLVTAESNLASARIDVLNAKAKLRASIGDY